MVLLKEGPSTCPMLNDCIYLIGKKIQLNKMKQSSLNVHYGCLAIFKGQLARQICGNAKSTHHLYESVFQTYAFLSLSLNMRARVCSLHHKPMKNVGGDSMNLDMDSDPKPYQTHIWALDPDLYTQNIMGFWSTYPVME